MYLKCQKLGQLNYFKLGGLKILTKRLRFNPLILMHGGIFNPLILMHGGINKSAAVSF